MCGIAGFLSPSKSTDRPLSVLKAMGDSILHRGPDSGGEWYDDYAGLSHRRLSILELTEAGYQPMSSHNGRFIFVFNGEIYNHSKIRDALTQSGYSGSWQGFSDTETLLAAIEFFGVEAALNMSIGMFAFALWDTRDKVLTLARDRFGEKPLYFGIQNNVFLFGSEIKSLKQHPSFDSKIDRNSISLFLRHNYIPAPYSIYQGIYKLEQGSILQISAAQFDPVIFKYWSSIDVAREAKLNQFEGSPEESIDVLEKLLIESINQQSIADVPLGAFLSGGIDSSAVVSILQSQSNRPVNTYSIGFDAEMFNEAKYAKAVANHLKTDHTELYVTSDDVLNIIPLLPSLYCEPFADSSQLPTYIVSKLAKSHVSVALSGDAGDELFCGYNRYTATNLLWRKLRRSPSIFRELLSTSINSISPEAWDLFFGISSLRKILDISGDKLHKGASVITSRTVDELYLRLVSHHANPVDLVIGAQDVPTILTSSSSQLVDFDDVSRMMLFDVMTYLPDDILVKVDRAAMAVSLETRVPFLDHRLATFAWSLPLSFKLRDGKSKWPLRELLYRYVPPELIDRPKMGFGVPLDRWLRGPLREWAESLLAEDRLRQEGYFRPEQIVQLWKEHLSGKHNRAYLLWNILMFQAWLEVN